MNTKYDQNQTRKISAYLFEFNEWKCQSFGFEQYDTHKNHDNFWAFSIKLNDNCTAWYSRRILIIQFFVVDLASGGFGAVA